MTLVEKVIVNGQCSRCDGSGSYYNNSENIEYNGYQTCETCDGEGITIRREKLLMSEEPCTFECGLWGNGRIYCIDGSWYKITEEHYEHKSFFGMTFRQLVPERKVYLGKCGCCFGTGKRHYHAESYLYEYKGCATCQGKGYILHEKWDKFLFFEKLHTQKEICPQCQGKDLAIREIRWQALKAYYLNIINNHDINKFTYDALNKRK